MIHVSAYPFRKKVFNHTDYIFLVIEWMVYDCYDAMMFI